MKALIAGSSPIVKDRYLTLMKDILRAKLLIPSSDARRTLGTCLGQNPEVVIVDARIPGIEGIELVLTMHQEKPAVVLVMLSPQANHRDFTQCGGAGGSLPLSPFDLGREFVEAVLENPISGSRS
jgi:CheY-like chemotaxis protein